MTSPDSRAKRKASDISGAEDDVDEPVLSHADLRRQKKKQKRSDGTQDSNAGEKSTPLPADLHRSAERKNKSDSLPKRQNSVWVGNLAFKTTPISLTAFFDGVGEITRINMPMKASTGKGPKENSGFAYVDFATPDAKVVAMTMSEQNLEGRRLLIKDGDDYSTKPGGLPKGEAGAAGPGLSKTAQKILNAQKQPAGPTLFFGNLSFQTTEQSIRQLLEAHRRIKTKKGLKDEPDKEEEDEEGTKVATKVVKDLWIRKVRLGTFEDTGVCKGWAFVDFTSTESATEALVNPRNHTLDGRKLNVEYASAEAVRRGGGPGDHKHPRKTERHKTEKDSSGPRQKRVGDQETRRETDNSDAHEMPGNQELAPPQEEKRTYKKAPHRSKDSAPSRRLKPGAALAQAQRASSAAIIPSQGQKIKF